MIEFRDDNQEYIFDNLLFFDDEIDYAKWLKPKSLSLFTENSVVSE